MIDFIITSSLLIAAVLLASRLSEKRVNPCIRYALWLLAAIKLLVPLPEFESNMSILNLTNEIEEQSVSYIFVDHSIFEDSGSENEIPAYLQGEKEGNIDKGIRTNTDAAQICRSIWLIGAAIFFCIFVWSSLCFAGGLRRSRKRLGKMRGGLPIYEAFGITSPCLFGFFSPAVYLPENMELSKEQRNYVMAHEYTHYRHGDHIWTLVRCMCVVLHWYNPLVWLAAWAAIRDSELACDAGTLKLIGQEHNLPYGKALIEIAKKSQSQPFSMQVLGCATSAAGGKKEMKKRIRMIAEQPRTKVSALLLLFIICINIVGCTFGAPAGEKAAEISENSGGYEAEPGESFTDGYGEDEAGLKDEGEETEKEESGQAEQGEISQNPDDMNYREVILTRQRDEGEVCIVVEPSVLRDYLSYYYIPENGDQEQLKKLIQELPAEGEVFDGKWEGMKETGWRLVYGSRHFTAFEDGYYLYYDEDGTEGFAEYLIRSGELSDYVQNILDEKLEYRSFDAAKIENIISAKLDVCSVFTDRNTYSQTITEEEVLETFEDWFSNGKYIFGGADCGNECACLTLTLADGNVVRLSVATDSCPNFAINGVYYDYRPVSVWDNKEFFEYFDEIPWNWDLS